MSILRYSIWSTSGLSIAPPPPPPLFIIFINDLEDLPQSLQDSVVDIFADDTTLSYCSHFTNANATQYALQTSANNLVKWSDDNCMVVNSANTKSMLVTGKRLKNKLTSDHQLLRINIDSTHIEQVKSQNLLGVMTSYVLMSISINLPVSWRSVLLKHTNCVVVKL